MAIRLTPTAPTAPNDNLTGRSHWWGFPDLPEGVGWPCRRGEEPNNNVGEEPHGGVVEESNNNVVEGPNGGSEEGEELLTFVCQVDLAEVAPLDREGLLPHEGMLWFFADLDYFLGDTEAPCEGTGEWPQDSFRVIYSPHCSSLHTHEAYWADGTPATLPAEAIVFAPAEESEFGHKLLGQPAMTEGYEDEDNSRQVSLLQVDEEERWGLRFFDCGLINFVIDRNDLRSLRFERVRLCLHTL